MSEWSKNFPEHTKAAQAQFQIGNVYFYTLYDYKGGWPAYVAVAEKFPDSYEASQAGTLLKQTAEILTEISFLKDEINKFRNKKAIEYQKSGRKITPADMWVMGYSDQVVQNFQQIAGNWEKIRNYPLAIDAYITLARDLSHKKFASADALFRVGSLHQQNGVSMNARFNLIRICLKTHQSLCGGMRLFTNRQFAIDPFENLNMLMKGSKPI